MNRDKDKTHICYRFQNQGSLSGPGIKYDSFVYDDFLKIAN